MKWSKRAAAAILAGVMAVSMMPQVWAAEEENSLPEQETTAQQPVQAEEQTIQPETPETPETPEQLKTPETPEQPETPETPEQPETPDKPQQESVALRTDHSAFMSGYPNGKFGVNDSLTWAQTSVVLYQLLADQSMGDLPCTYTDVKETDWFYQAVTTLASRGILTDAGGAFHPNDTITRGDFVCLMVRLVGVDEDAVSSFSDVAQSDPIYPSVSTAAQRGWISGYSDGTFRPNAALTRAESVVVFGRVLDRKMDTKVLQQAQDLREFVDVPASHWAYGAVLEASIDHDGAANEDGTETWNSYTPSYPISLTYSGKTVTRNIYQGTKPYHVPEKDDSGKDITHWMTPNGVVADPLDRPVSAAAAYVAWYAPKLMTAHNQYISGYGKNQFGPQDSLTRAQACAILYGLLTDQSYGSYPCDFPDVPAGAWYEKAVKTLASRGFVATGEAFEPNQPMTRAEFVEMVSRLVAYTDRDSQFTDVGADDPYYHAIVTAAAQGWIGGFGDGTFRPNEPLTRTQAVTVYNKILGRTGDKTTEQQMDERYTFGDVSKGFWGYQAIMEAATTHTYKKNGDAEAWSEYTHKYTESVSWESSTSVVAASKITNKITSTYRGDYTQKYNMDYANGLKESYINGKGYSSKTKYLVWVSRQNQKVYVFSGSKQNWKLIKTFICGTGKDSTPTPTGVTYITYREKGWNHDTYSCKPVVRFYPNTGYAFHSRLYYPNYNGLKDKRIGFPISAGCVRMLDTDITYLYKNIPNNSTVVIY